MRGKSPSQGGAGFDGCRYHRLLAATLALESWNYSQSPTARSADPPIGKPSHQSPSAFLSFFDLSDKPRREDMRLIASGERPSCLAACSSVNEDLASSMSRRSSLNDQGLRAITETILFTLLEEQSRRADPCSLDGFAGWGRAWGSPVQD